MFPVLLIKYTNKPLYIYSGYFFSMKSIILTDTHIDYDRNPEISYRKEQAIRSLDKNVDCVLLCGDNAELAHGLSNHRIFFGILKEIFNCPFGFIVENHELWGKNQISKNKPNRAVEDFFQNAKKYS